LGNSTLSSTSRRVGLVGAFVSTLAEVALAGSVGLFIIAGLVLLALATGFVSACSQKVVDRPAVDAIVDRAIEAVHSLRDLGQAGALPSMIATLDVASDDFDNAGKQLWPRPPSGVPESTARDVSSKFESVASAIKEAAACLSQFASNPLVHGGSDCEGADRIAAQKGVTAGEAIADLVPYGSRTREDVQALMDTKPPDRAPPGDRPLLGDEQQHWRESFETKPSGDASATPPPPVAP